MKKNFLFSMLAVLLAGFWFGGVTLAYPAVSSNCEWLSITDSWVLAVSSAEDFVKWLQCNEVRVINLNSDIEINTNVISTKNPNLKLNLWAYKITADTGSRYIELYWKYEIVWEEWSDIAVKYIDAYWYDDVTWALIITSWIFHTNMYPNDDTTITINWWTINWS